MAFPISPTEGQIHYKYIYNTDRWVMLGDIVESGDGFIKYSNGTLHQWGYETTGVIHTNQGYFVVNYTFIAVDFPIPFIGDLPQITGNIRTNYHDAFLAGFYDETLTNFSGVASCGRAEGITNRKINWSAIGRWK